MVKISRGAKNHVRLRPAGTVLASLQGRTVDEIAEMFAAWDHHVRDVIHVNPDRALDSWS